jgi:hypothetical protein
MVDNPQYLPAVDASTVLHTKRQKNKSRHNSHNDRVTGKWEHFPGFDETLVIVKADQRTVFVGRLVEINQDYLAFDYVVLDSNLAVYMHSVCEVNLKSSSNPEIHLESIPCIVVNDTYIQSRSFFDIPMRRCSLEFTRQLSLAEIQSFI